MRKPYPPKEELNKLWWHNAGKILKWIIVILTVFAPLMSGESVQSTWLIDGVIGAVINFLILSGIGFIFMRIMYRKPQKKSIQN